MLRSNAVGVSTLGNVKEVIALQRRRRGSQCIPRERGLSLVATPPKISKPHGLPLCWVARGGVLWCPRMIPLTHTRHWALSQITDGRSPPSPPLLPFNRLPHCSTFEFSTSSR